MNDAATTCVLLVLLAAGCHANSCDDPLFLTPYLEKEEVARARELSLVNDPRIYNGTSYAGYLTVDKDLGNHLFFWYFPSMQRSDAPLLLWLNGGPTITSMQGLFMENGPMDTDFKPRDQSWVGPFSMLYIDNPVGTGYSFTENRPEGLRTTQKGYTEDLYSAIRQFYQLFSDSMNSDLYVGGQSYAGKYVPALAHRIHVGNQQCDVNLPLKGIYIGGPLFAPEEYSYAYLDFAYSLGYLSIGDVMKKKEQLHKLFDAVQNGEQRDGFDIMDIILKWKTPGSQDNFITGAKIDTGNTGVLSNVLNKKQLQQAIHVGAKKVEAFNYKLYHQIVKADFLVHTKPQMTELLNNYKVLIFNGEYDLIVNSASVEAEVLSLAWDYADEYRRTKRTPWFVDNTNKTVKGYYSQTRTFCRVIVHGSGHQVPRDQPTAALDMMTQFVGQGCLVPE